MGRWGMGMSSSDEFQDVKDEFFDLFYYTDEPLNEIEKSILDNYRENYSSFDSDDGVWHDVYFALADCEWSCGQLSERILSEITRIIENDLDIAYMESLSAAPQDLKKRKQVLEKFLDKLSTPKEKPVKRKLRKPFVSPFKTGDVFLYKYSGYFYGGIVLQVWDDDENCDLIYKKDTLNYCIAVAAIKSVSPVSVEQIENAEVLCVEWLIPYNLPKVGKFEIIGNIADKISKDYSDYFCARKTRYGLSFSGIFAEDFLRIISGEKDYGGYLKRQGIFNKSMNYLFDTSRLKKPKL